MALKSKSLKKAAKAAKKSGNKKVDQIVANAPKATHYGLKTAAHTFMPFYAKSAQSFAKQHRDLTNWLRNSSPFRSSPGTVSANERRITNNAKSVLAAFKTDLKKGHLLDFRNTNAAFNKAIGGVMEEGFDDNYDAEMMVGDDSGSSGDTASAEPTNYDALFSDMLGNDTYVETQQAATSATLDAIDNATGAMADATIGAAEYSANRITAGVNVAIAHMADYQIQTNEILSEMNNNIASLVEQNNANYEFQSQTLEFFHKTEDSLNQLIELTKYSVGKSEDKYGGRDREDPYDFLAGGKFDFKKFSNNLWHNSQFGQLIGMMVGQWNPILQFFGIDLSSKFGNSLGFADTMEFNPIKDFYEKSPLKRIIDRVDEDLQTTTRVLFDKLATGKVQTGIGWFDDILSSFAQMGGFGEAKLSKISRVRGREFDNKKIGHLTEATVGIIETVIPDYLSRMELNLRDIATGLRDGSIASSFEILNPEAVENAREKRKNELQREKEMLMYGEYRTEKYKAPKSNQGGVSDEQFNKLIALLESNIAGGKGTGSPYSPGKSSVPSSGNIKATRPGNVHKKGEVVDEQTHSPVGPQKIKRVNGRIDRNDKNNRDLYDKYKQIHDYYTNGGYNSYDESATKAAYEDYKQMEWDSVANQDQMGSYKSGPKASTSDADMLKWHTDEYIDKTVEKNGKKTTKKVKSTKQYEINASSQRALSKGELKNLAKSKGKKYKISQAELQDINDRIDSGELDTDYLVIRALGETKAYTDWEKKTRYYSSKHQARMDEIESQKEAERRKTENAGKIKELEDAIRGIENASSSAAERFVNASFENSKVVKSRKEGTFNNDRLIFDQKNSKMTTEGKALKDYASSVKATATGAFTGFVEQVMKLIGTKDKKKPRMAALQNYIATYGLQGVSPGVNPDAVDSLFRLVFDPDGVGYNVFSSDDYWDSENNRNLSLGDAQDYLLRSFMDFVRADAQAADRMSEINEEIANGGSALASLLLSDNDGTIRKQLEQAQRLKPDDIKFFLFGDDNRPYKERKSEWVKSINDALKNEKPKNADNLKDVMDSMIDALDSMQDLDPNNDKDELRKARKKYNHSYTMWANDPFGQAHPMFPDGIHGADSLMGMYGDTSPMQIFELMGLGDFIGTTRNIEAFNPAFIHKLAVNRAPLMLVAKGSEELSDFYLSAHAGDKNLVEWLRHAFTGSSEGDEESEGSGWGRSVGRGANGNHYSQMAYGDIKYGDTTMAKGACGPVALANAFNRMGISVDPVTLATISEAMGYAVDGGTSAGLFTNGVNALGLKGKQIGLGSIRSALRSGNQVILAGKSMGGGMYTPAGHIISLNGIKGNNVGVDDPLKSFSEVKSMKDVLKGAKHAWSVGSGDGDTPDSTGGATTNDSSEVPNVLRRVDDASKTVRKFANSFKNGTADFQTQEAVLGMEAVNAVKSMGSGISAIFDNFFGPKGYITSKINKENSEKRKKFLFGEKDANGFYTGGLLGAKTANEIAEIPKWFRNQITGEGYKSYAKGEIAESEGLIGRQRRKMLIKNYGENYRDDPRYQALPDHMKDPEDREYKPKLTMAASSVGDNGVAKDTYDYGKYRKIYGGEIQGWVWNEGGWKFYVRNPEGKVEKLTPSGDWSSELTDETVLPSITCTEEVMKQAYTKFKNAASVVNDGKLIRHGNVPTSKFDSVFSALGGKTKPLTGPHGEAYDDTDYKTVESKVMGLSIVGWRYESGSWRFVYSFHSSTKNKGVEYSFKTSLTDPSILPPDHLTESICQALITAGGKGQWDDDSQMKVHSSHFSALEAENKKRGITDNEAWGKTRIKDSSFSKSDVVWVKDTKARCWSLVMTKSNGDVSTTVFPNYNNLEAAPDADATKRAMAYVENLESDENSNSNTKKGLFGKKRGVKGTKGYKAKRGEDGTLKTNRVASSFYDALYDASDAVEDIKKKGRSKRWLLGAMGFMLGGLPGVIPGMIAGTAIGAFEKTDLGKNTKAYLFGGKDAKGEKHQGLFGGLLGTVKKVLLGKNTFAGVVGAIIGGMMGGPGGALAGASVLSHLFDKSSKLRKLILGHRDESGKWQDSFISKGIKGIFKFLFSKGHRAGAVLGGIAGAAGGIPGILLGSAIGGHVAETGFKKIVKFSGNIKKGKQIAAIAEAYRNKEINLHEAKKQLGKIRSIGGKGVKTSLIDEEVKIFLMNGDNSTYQKWLDSGLSFHDFYNGPSAGAKAKKSDDSATAEAAKSVSTSEGSGPSINSATLKAIDEHDKLEKASMEANVETPNAIQKLIDVITGKITRDEKNAAVEKRNAVEAEQTTHVLDAARKKKDDNVSAASQGDHDEESSEDKEEKKGGFFSSLLSGAGSLLSNLGVKGLAIGAGALFAFSKLKDTKFGQWVGGLLTKAMNGLGSLIGNALSKVDWSSLVKSVSSTLVSALKGAGNLVGSLIDGLTDHKTDFQSYDENGNRVSNSIDNAFGVSYNTEYNPETGENETKATVNLGNSTMLTSTANLMGKSAAGSLFSNRALASTTFDALQANSADYLKYGGRAHDFVSSIPKRIANGLGTAGSFYAESKNPVVKLIGKIMQGIEKIIDSITGLFSKKFNTDTGKISSKMGDLLQKLRTKLLSGESGKHIVENFDSFSAKVTEIMTSSAVKTATVALEVADVINRAVSGAAWKANDLFRVKETDVNGRMRTISSIITAVCGEPSGIGAIVEFISDFIENLTGWGFKHELAVLLYKLVSSDEDDKKLDQAIENYDTRLAIYNSISNDKTNTPAFSKMTEKNELDLWVEGVAQIFGTNWQTKHGKQVDAINSQINQAEAQMINKKGGAITKDDLYLNTSVENMTADDETEGYGSPKSVGYGASNSTHYSQLDKTWRNVNFGRMNSGTPTTIGTGGCGPTALANVARNLTGNKHITPSTVASMAQDYGYTANGGSAASLFTEGASRLGLSSRRVGIKDVPSAMAAGHKIILSGKREGAGSPYTDAGHIISVNGIKNGKAIVDDPLKSTTETLSVNKLLSGAKKAWVVDKGNAGYGTTDPQEYLDNLEAMGYGFRLQSDVEGSLSINEVGDPRILANPHKLSNGSYAMYYLQYPFSGVHSENKAENLWKDKPLLKYARDPAWEFDSDGNPIPGGKNDNYDGYKTKSSFHEGCIPTAYANILSSITGLDIDPLTLTRLYETVDGKTIQWNNYNWSLYDTFYELLTGSKTHNDKTNWFKYGNGSPYGLSNISMDSKNLVANTVSRVRGLLSDGGGVLVDTHGTTKIANGKSYGGHAFGLYGYFKGDGTENSDGFYTLEPGRSNNSFMVTPHTFEELAYDLTDHSDPDNPKAGFVNIRNMEGFPNAYNVEAVKKRIQERLDKVRAADDAAYHLDADKSSYAGVPIRGYDESGNVTTTAYNFTKQAFESFDLDKSSTIATDEYKNSVAATQAAQDAIDAQNAQNYQWTPDQDYFDALQNKYTGPNAEDWDKSDSLGAKISNIFLAVAGIGQRYLEKVFGGTYNSVFGGGSSGSSSGQDYNVNNSYADATSPVKNAVYSIRTPGGKHNYESIQASRIAGNLTDEQLDALVDELSAKAYPDLVKWSMTDGTKKMKNGRPLIDKHDTADESKWTLSRYATEADRKSFNALVTRRKRLRIYIKEAIKRGGGPEGFLKVPLTLTDKSGKTFNKDFFASLGGTNTIANVVESIRLEYPAKSRDDLANYKGEFMYISDDDIYNAIGKSIDTDNNQKFDDSAMVYDKDGRSINTYRTFMNESRASSNSNGPGNWGWDVSIPNDLPVTYADTGLTKGQYQPDPGVAFMGDTAYSKISNNYEQASISSNPKAYGAKVVMSQSDFNTKYLHTLTRDLRTFKPINASTMDQLINELSSSDSPYRTYRAADGSTLGQAFVDAANLSGIDPRMILVQSGIESAWGKSNIAKKKGNLFGIGASDDAPMAKAFTFVDKDGKINLRNSVLAGAQWISTNFINRNEGDYSPQSSLATMGWSDYHVYGSGHPANGTQFRTAYANGIAPTLNKAEGYGDLSAPIIDENEIDPGLRQFFNVGSNSSSGYGTARNTMSISATRNYTPRSNTSIDNSSSTRVNAPVDVNVNLSVVESCARSMVSLLERIASNTGRSTGNTTNITNNYDNHNEVGYGDVKVNATTTQKTKTATPVTKPINNNYMDKFRQIHNVVAKSSR